MKKCVSLLLILVTLLSLSQPAFAKVKAAEELAGFQEIVAYYDGTSDVFVYNDDMLRPGQHKMSGDLAKVGVGLSAAAYYEDYIYDILAQMGCTDIWRFNYTKSLTLDDNDYVAYAIGRKTVGDTLYYIVAVRGTKGLEWFSDFNVGDPHQTDGWHLGFKKAADRVAVFLRYLFGEDGASGANRRILFTGHSRGAAVANILAKTFTDEGAGAVYGYTFACPRVRWAINNNNYDNIYNFNNAGDAVPCLPLEKWNYDWYGHTDSFSFSDMPIFQLQYTREFGDQNGSLGDSDTYERLFNGLFPKVSDLEDPARRLFLDLLSWKLMCEDSGELVSFQDVMRHYTKEGYAPQLIVQSLINTLGIMNVYHTFITLKNDIDRTIRFLEDAYAIWGYMSDEEYSQENFDKWLKDENVKPYIDEIFELTGEHIKSRGDLIPKIKWLKNMLETVIDFAILICCIADIDLQNENGDALQALKNGHSPRTYVPGINQLYFGYAAHQGESLSQLNLEIPDCVRTIAPNCFQDSGLATLKGLDHVEYCGSFSFRNLFWMTEVKFNQLKALGVSAFEGCSRLRELDLGQVEVIGPYAFRDCVSLTSLYIPESVREIRTEERYGLYVDSEGKSLRYSIFEGPFTGCTGVRTISVGGVETLTEGALGTNGEITSLKIRGSVKKIDERALSRRYEYDGYFSGYTPGSELILEEGVEEIGYAAFMYCGFSTISLPSTLKKLGSYAFSGCTKLSAVTLSNIETVGYKAFSNCTGLSAVTLSDVKAVSEHAFSDCTALRSLDLGTVERIGPNAFRNCVSLPSLYIPDTVQVLSTSFDFNNKKYAGPFTGCTGIRTISVGGPATLTEGMLYTGGEITSLTVRGSVRVVSEKAFSSSFSAFTLGSKLILEEGLEEIGESAFNSCGFGTLSFPSTLKAIGDRAFQYCTAVKTLTLTQPMVEVGEKAFQGCTGLTAASLPALKTVGFYAFAGCTALRTVEMPNAKTVDFGAFQGCTALSSIEIPNAETVGFMAFKGCTGLTAALLPAVRMVDDEAFADCTALSTVEISNAEYVGNGAFQGCISLSAVTLSRVRDVGDQAFDGCTSLKSLDLGKVIEEIGGFAFRNCVSLPSLDLGAVKVIWYCAFENCVSLTSMYIPDTVQHIYLDYHENSDKGPFYGCTGLKSISIGGVDTLTKGIVDTDVKLLSLTVRGTVRAIGKSAFDSIIASEIVLEEGVEEIGFRAFASCACESISLPSTLKMIDDSAFQNCTAVKTLTLTQPMERLGEFAFQGCTGLSAVTLSQVKAVGDYAFDGCTGLKSLELGTVESIGAYAFRNCVSLPSLYIPDTARELRVMSYSGEYNRGPFSGCVGIRTISVGGLPVLSQGMLATEGLISRLTVRGSVRSIGDRAFDSSYSTGYYPAFSGFTEDSELILEEGVEEIGVSAFAQCGFSKLSLPSTLKTIGDRAFYGCPGAMTLTITQPMEKIGSSAFKDCTGLSAVSVYDVGTIGAYAFENCRGLLSVSIHDAEAVGDAAFCGCMYLSSLRFGGMGQPFSDSAFTDCTALTVTLTIPNPDLAAYCEAHGIPWIADYTGLTLPAGLTTIEAEAFSGSSVSYVLIPESVTSIGDFAFAMCDQLHMIEFSSADADIGVWAFWVPRTVIGGSPAGPEPPTIMAPAGGSVEQYARDHYLPFIPLT